MQGIQDVKLLVQVDMRCFQELTNVEECVWQGSIGKHPIIVVNHVWLPVLIVKERYGTSVSPVQLDLI